MACDPRIDAAELDRLVQGHLDAFRREQQQQQPAIPSSMQLQPSMKQAMQNHALSDAIFLPLPVTNAASNDTAVSVGTPERGTAVLQRHSGSVGSIAWVVRRVQCSFCRHQAAILTTLVRQCPEYFAASQENETPRFQVFGIIKDTWDEQGILEFQRDYFPFPLYVDPSMAFYQALGDRKLSLSQILSTKEAWKSLLCSAYQSVFPTKPTKMTRRASSSSSSSTSLEEKKIAASTSTTATMGDGMVLGGFIVMNHDCLPVAMFPEQPGPTLPLGDLLQTLQAVMTKHSIKPRSAVTEVEASSSP